MSEGRPFSHSRKRRPRLKIIFLHLKVLFSLVFLSFFFKLFLFPLSSRNNVSEPRAKRWQGQFDRHRRFRACDPKGEKAQRSVADAGSTDKFKEDEKSTKQTLRAFNGKRKDVHFLIWVSSRPSFARSLGDERPVDGELVPLQVIAPPEHPLADPAAVPGHHAAVLAEVARQRIHPGVAFPALEAGERRRVVGAIRVAI